MRFFLPENLKHFLLSCVLFTIALISATLRLEPQSGPILLTTTRDTYLKQGTPNTNQGAEPVLRIQATGNNRVLVGLDQAAIAQAVGGGPLSSAKLRLYITSNLNNWGSAGQVVNVHRMTAAWNELGATWNCPQDSNTNNASPDCNPAWEMGPAGPVPFALAPTNVILHQNNQLGWVEWDVTADVARFLDHSTANLGWVVRKDDEAESGQVTYSSREGSFPPQLVITLGGTPQPSPQLSPVADAYIGSGYRNENHGNQMALRLRAAGNNRALLQFDQAAMISRVGSGTLQAAKLRLYIVFNGNNWPKNGQEINVHRMNRAWSEQGSTWNCPDDTNPFNSQPDCGSGWEMQNSGQWPFVASRTASVLHQNNLLGWVEWDVTADARRFLDGSTPNNGWILRKDNEAQSGQIEYASRESEFKPQLILTVSVTNQAPQVSAGSDQTITLPATVNLSGTVSDDGLPPGSTLSVTWSKLSGPGSVAFSNANAASTQAIFSVAGNYVLRLTATDTYLTTTDDVSVAVLPAPINQPPQVSAGPDQTITLPATANLGGTASDDGLPPGSTLTITWSQLSGPGAVTFSNGSAPSTQATFSVAGNYVLRLTANDTNLNATDDVSIVVLPAPINQPPQVSTGADQTVTLPATASLSGTATDDGLPAGSTLSVTWSKLSGPGNVTFSAPNAAVSSANFSVAGIYVLRLTASDSALSSSDDVAVTVIAAGPPLPPDPATVAPPLNNTVPTSVFSSTQFLYTGTDPIQTGVTAGTIKALRVAVLRGSVRASDGTGLTGVTITVLNHPEFGQTLSRADGAFDIAVNGGGPLIVNYEKSGYLRVQRQLETPWQDFAFVPQAIMLPVDSQVTTVVMNSGSSQVARGSVMTDSSGSRRATLFFPGDTTATMVLPNGTTQPLNQLELRATEYSVGPNGPDAMPAPLPPESNYTYALEYSVDAALAAGATRVQFNQPVVHYNENFLGFPTGTVIPSGYYDRQRGAWVPGRNGQVIYILSIQGGQALLDLSGSNTPADASAYAARGITGPERQQLAILYSPGQSLWRVPIDHLTPWDCNLGVIPTNGTFPNVKNAESKERKQEKSCTASGSIIECQNQILGESLGLVGAPASLEYQSDLVPGRKIAYSLDIPLSGSIVPTSLEKILLKISVAGQHFVYEFPPAPDQSYTFHWDGKDAYDRKVNGQQKVHLRIGYRYEADYSQANAFARNDGVRIQISNGGGGSTFAGARTLIILWQDQEAFLGTFDASELGIGGWRLSQHHLYDPIARTLNEGNGSRRGLQSVNQVITTVAGGGSNASWYTTPGGVPGREAQVSAGPMAAAADGGVYIHFDGRLNRLDSAGILTRIPNYAGAATGVAVDAQGYVYVADAGVLKRVNPVDGSTVVIAGTGQTGFSGDNGPATNAEIDASGGVAAGSDGSLYIAGGHRLRKIDTAGNIATIAGTGSTTYSGDGGPALTAGVPSPANLIISADGSLYFTSPDSSGYGDNRIRRVSPAGTISSVLSRGGNTVDAMALGPDGSLYVTNFSVSFSIFGSIASSSLSRLTPQGAVEAVTSTGVQDNGLGTDSRFRGDDGPPGMATVGRIQGLAFTPDGYFYVADASTSPGRIRRISPGAPDFRLDENIVPSEDGSQIYIFSGTGSHLRTLDALTGGLLYQFAYDSDGFLISMTDGDNQVTTIHRDGNGNATAIVGPHGQTTLLVLGSGGYLSSVTNPKGEATTFTYHADGLMATMKDPKQNQYSFQFDSQGLLTRDDDPAGGFKTLSRVDLVPPFQGETTGGFEATVGTSLSSPTKYQVTQEASGNRTWTNTAPDNTQTISTFSIYGSDVSTSADGTITSLIKSPEPRWGMQAPLTRSLSVRLPSNLTSTVTSTRAVTLSQPFNPLSLATQTDTVTINGRTYTSVFNNATKTLASTSPSGRQSSSVLDNLGRVLQSQLASLYSVRFSYDTQGRPETMKQGTGTDERTTTFAYNPEGYLQTLTHPLNRTASFQYDDAGQVTQQTLPGNRTIGFNYDANGNLASLTPPNRPQHGFDYTEVDLQKEYDPPVAANVGTRLTTTGYDTERKPTLITRPDGQTLDFDYDSAGRLSTLNLPGRQLAYSYNSTTGNLSGIADSAGSSLAYTYDGSLPKSSTWSGAVTGSIAWNYDNNFRVISRSTNGGNTISFNYDNDGLLTSAGGLTLTRDAQNGFLTNSTLGNVTDTWAYSSFGELSSYSASAGGVGVYATSFTRDKLGRIATKVETIGGITDTYVYGYDSAGRLETVTKNGSLISSYTYDGNGNRLSRSTAAGTAVYTTDNQDRLTTWNLAPDTWNLTYTANGELQSKTSGSQTTTYSYDVVGNLRHVTLPDATQIDYIVDAQNRRVGKKMNGVLVQGWLYGNQLNPIAELNGSNQIVSQFIYASRANIPDYLVKNGITYRIISDQLGSPRLVINTADGSLVQRLDYDEFGNVTQDTNPSFQPFAFAGGLYDSQTHLTRFGARDYDSETGRWTAKDPIQFEGGDTNLYGYVLDDPINLIDESGLLLHPLPKIPDWVPEWLAPLFEPDPFDLMPTPLASVGKGCKLVSPIRKLKPVIIGEGMKRRVIPYAEEVGGHYWKPRGFENLEQKQKRWIQRMVNQGREIIDLGIDISRQVRSRYYEIENQFLDKLHYPTTKP